MAARQHCRLQPLDIGWVWKESVSFLRWLPGTGASGVMTGLLLWKSSLRHRTTARSTFTSFPQRRAGTRLPSNSAIDFQFASYASILAQLLFQQLRSIWVLAKTWWREKKYDAGHVWIIYTYIYVETVWGVFRYVESTIYTIHHDHAAGSHFCTTRTRC